MRRSRKAEVGVRVHPKNRCGNGGHEERAIAVADVNAVVPQMRLTDERWRKSHPGLAAYGKRGVIVWLNVVSE